MKIRRVLAVSDLHAGSTVGLWPKSLQLDGGNPLEANKYQLWLLECWQKLVEEASKLKPDAVVINGDALQGVASRDGQLVTSRVDTQQRAAKTLLAPITNPVINRGGKVYMVRGTEYHDGRGAENCELLAESLGCEEECATGQYSRWELYLALDHEKDGPVVHFAHHVGIAGVTWGEASGPLRDLIVQTDELRAHMGNLAPNVKMIVRSHRHRFVHAQVFPDRQVLVLPGWQLKTAYTHKKATATMPQVGYAWIEYDGRDIIVKPRLFPLPGVTLEGL